MNIKIAVIDTGIDKFVSRKSICNVRHFSLNNGAIIEKYKPPIQKHGTLCFYEILKQNVAFDVIDINLSDENNALKLENIVLAIERSIELKVDIINISLGAITYSPELFDVCQKAINNNVVIISAASHTSEISYPSVLKNVVGIYTNQKQKNVVEKISDSTLSIKMADKVIYENGIKYDISSTSMASAYFAGLLAKQLEKNPVLDKFILLKKLYDLKINSKLEYIDEIKYDKLELYKQIEDKKVAVVLLPSASTKQININLKLNNIVAIYNHQNQKFYTFNGSETFDFEVVLVINSSQYETTISDELLNHFQNYKLIFIGKFKDLKTSNLIYKHKNYNSETLSTLSKPLVLITGISWDLGKFDVQKALVESFKKNNFAVKAMSYNMLGCLYGFDVFDYPDKIIFPDIVCSINNYMYCAEANNDFDIWIGAIGGGMFINNFNKFSFGKLTESYFNAADVDVLIFVLPTFIELEQLELNIIRAKTYGVKKILFIVSQNTFESSTLKALDAIKTYCVDEKKYSENIKYLRSNSNEEIFTYEDIAKGKLYKKIVRLLS